MILVLIVLHDPMYLGPCPLRVPKLNLLIDGRWPTGTWAQGRTKGWDWAASTGSSPQEAALACL
ncbi:hypothetical protein LguiB_014150 [Lonicera macranthoides]